MDRSRWTTTTVVYLLLVTAVGVAILVQDRVTIPTVSALPAPAALPDDYDLIGVVYDFKESHADFGVVPAGGYGHYAGNVAGQLDAGRPTFIGWGAADYAAWAAIPRFSGELGYDTTLPDSDDGVKEVQIATRVSVPASVILTSMSAYVGGKEEDIRYAVYSDDGGEPGTLLAETAIGETSSGMSWLTLPLPNVLVPAGDYWLALCFNNDDQIYRSAATGGVTRTVEHKAVEDGYLASWGSSDSSTTQRVSLYATAMDASAFANFGVQTPLAGELDKVKEQQVATRVTMPEAGTVLSISAYVGNKEHDVRYAIYADAGGEPGALIAESVTERTSGSMKWLTLFIDDTPLPAGDYWLALSFRNDDQAVSVGAGGQTRQRAGKATQTGFVANWGSSESSSGQQLAMYATYTTDTGPVSYPGYKVTTEWQDAMWRPIAPQMFGVGADDVVDFVIDGQTVIPDGEFAVELRVLGAAIQSGSSGYHIPITMRIFADATGYEPFGPFDDAVYGNLNDDQTVTCFNNGVNPRCAVLPTTFPAGTELRIDGRSWSKDGADGCLPSSWDPNMNVSTDSDSIQLEVLRNGDPVPQIPALYDQDSIADYVGDYIDLDTGTMSMAENQVIYLFELGTSGGSSSADFQDLVILMTLANDTAGLCGTPIVPGEGTVCGSPIDDTEGDSILAGEIDASGGIDSADSFAEWFEARMGTNMTEFSTITLTNDGTGVYEFLTDEFFPIDNEGMGNEGELHNHFFTIVFQADFTYEQCGGQFIEFEGDDDAWLFVNGKLVMDLGGMRSDVSQYVEMDRLGLTDGAIATIRLFHARRQDLDSTFRLRTNILLETSGHALLSHAYD